MMIVNDNLPRHIAIIMDGNGRWAKRRLLPRTEGHRRGIGVIRKIIDAALDLKIEVLSFFAFSTENWDRPKVEINMLMRSLEDFLAKEHSDLERKKVRFVVSGNTNDLPDSLQKRLKEVIEKTMQNSKLTVNLCLNYGGRLDILNAAKRIAADVSGNKLKINEVGEKLFSDYLYTAGLPDPDLLIRTSGEQRISNFLLWQLSYAELLFTKVLWPDFSKKDLILAINEYQSRNRRFGKVG